MNNRNTENDPTLLIRARAFAHGAHRAVGQKRKYTGEPYDIHTDSVSNSAKVAGASVIVQAASHLHDTLEDTRVTFQDLESEFGTEIALIVLDVTDMFTHENFPAMNREQRKAAEAERISKIAKDSKLVKFFDLMDNTSSIAKHDKDFAVVYLREKARVLEVIRDADEHLYLIASQQIAEAKTLFGIE